MSPRQKRLVVPILVIALVCSTLLYGYHSQTGINFDRRPSSRGPHRPFHDDPDHRRGHDPEFDPDFGPGLDHEIDPEHDHHGPPHHEPGHGPSDLPDYGAIYESIHELLQSNNSEPSLWTSQEIADLPKQPYTKHNEYVAGQIAFNHGEEFDDRVRYESGDVWRSRSSLLDKKTGSKDLPRVKVPPRFAYPSDGEYLPQVIPGDFKNGAERVFFMLKTGADTQWKRMPMHFMTDLTHVENFALYSDAPGSIFGHEVVDIIATLPQDIIDGRWELERYRAHMQSHNEHWNWAPEQLKADGGWLVDRYKNIPILWDAYTKNPNCDWYMWVDDDSYVFYDTLLKWLDTMDPNEMIYHGSTSGLYFEDEYYNFAHGGSVVVVSNAVAKGLFGPEGTRKVELNSQDLLDKWARMGANICCGDALVAVMLKQELNVTLYVHPELQELVWYGGTFQGESLSRVVMPEQHFCQPVATWHHLTPHDMEVLYTYERLWSEDRAILYSDIYRDFFLPYIVEERPNWAIADSARTIRYPDGDQEADVSIEVNGQTLHPAMTMSDCKAACAHNEECLAWSWRAEYCMLQVTGITFGTAANKWNAKEGFYSGWMVDRIRDLRANSPCDPLQKVDGVFNDDEWTSEGWMLRKIEREQQHGAFKVDSTFPIGRPHEDNDYHEGSKEESKEEPEESKEEPEDVHKVEADAHEEPSIDLPLDLPDVPIEDIQDNPPI